MKRRIPAVLAAGGLLCSCSTLPPPSTVKSVDLARYAGTWHEIQAFPNWFQRGCEDSTATYTTLPDGKIRVVNSCTRNGKTTSVTGTATPVPGSNNSRLKVRFFGPFAGDYWILDLDKNYRWVAVGHPNRQYLWILARTPQLDPATLARIRTRLAAQGYDVSRLVSSAGSHENEAP